MVGACHKFKFCSRGLLITDRFGMVNDVFFSYPKKDSNALDITKCETLTMLIAILLAQTIIMSENKNSVLACLPLCLYLIIRFSPS